MPDLTTMTIASAARALRAGETTPVELADAYLDRIAALNPSINAYVTVTADRARADARAAQDELVAGRDRGLLHGVPIGLKDLFETAGIRTTAGSKVFAEYVPEADCPAATRLRDAGSVLLGKLNTHEFAFGSTTNNVFWGATHNPWNLERIPGGSSGGSGAAIAASLATATMGTDTGGSIRMPAAACGCVGLKPTYGRVSKRGVFPMSHLYDHAGPITRTVEDAAIMLQVLAGYDPLDPNSANVPVPYFAASLHDGVRGMRIGLLRGMFAEVPDPEILAAIDEAAATLRSLGALVDEVEPGFEGVTSGQGFRAVYAEAHAIHGDNWATRPEDFGPGMQNVLKNAQPSAREVAESLDAAGRVRAACQELLTTYDLLLAPTMPVTAPPINGSTINIAGKEVSTEGLLASLTLPFNLARLPVLSQPCGFSSDGLPISLSFVGRAFDEVTVLRAGQAYEDATDWHLRRPTLP